MNVVDTHVHVWHLDRPDHEWPTAAEAAIHRDHDLADYRRAAAAAPAATVIGAILVQAQQHEAETHRLLALGAADDLVRGVVGWVDLTADDVALRIADLARDPLLKGLRPMVQCIADDAWLLRPDVARGLAAMVDHGLRLDALVQPRHLPVLANLARAWPLLPIVINHAAKPVVPDGIDPAWRDGIAALADLGLYCKLSGLRTEQPSDHLASALRPFVDHLLAQFGTRLMWGSDWPVIRLAGDDFADWFAAARGLADAADPVRLFAGCAAEFYDTIA